MKRCPFCAEEIQDAAIVCKHCGRDLVAQPTAAPPKRKPVGCYAIIAAVIVGMAVVLAMIGMVSDSRRSSTPVQRAVADERDSEEPSGGITMANFLLLKDGMSYPDVVKILGEPGEEISRVSIADMETVMYQWSAEWSLGNMNVTFQNGGLVQKAQFGLK